MKWVAFCFFNILFLCGCCQLAARPGSKTTPTAPAPAPTVVFKVPAPPQTTVTTVVKEKDVSCNLLSAPHHAPLPVAPEAENGAVLSEHQKLVLMQSYIWSLRTYIKQNDVTEDHMYGNFVKACLHTSSPATPASVAGK